MRIRVHYGGALVSDIVRGVLWDDRRFRVHGSVVFSDPSTCTFVPDGITSFPMD